MGLQLRIFRVELVIVALILPLLLTGCGGGGGGGSQGSAGVSNGASGGTGGPEKKTLTVAGLPLADVAALHIAIDRGLFAEQGLTVRVRPVQQSVQALPALANGQVDIIGGANYVTFLQARERGTLATRVLAEAARNAPRLMGVLVLPDSEIRTPEDLRGKRVGVNILNNIQSLSLNSALRERGAGLPAYLQVPFPQMGALLERGQVDAVHAVEPFASAIKRDLNARTVIDGAASPADGLPLSGYVTTQRFTDTYPRTAAAFQRAIAAAQTIADRDRDAVEQVLPGYTKIEPAEAAAIGLPGYPPVSSSAELTRLIAMMRDQGLLTEDMDAADLLFEPGR
ncbi:ABC transporter substrate-binding protein [Streptomyces sp. NPDC101062]|uniref:ABC transporter substrate-binding protein n=1 Tax=unclassified Streptomyces TaxID=2593676 RepID=UPI0037F41BFA